MMSSSTETALDDSGEPTVSLDDINQENSERRALEADARAVLGNSDAENCTWDQGYVERQALYACVTCRHDVKVRKGDYYFYFTLLDTTLHFCIRLCPSSG